MRTLPTFLAMLVFLMVGDVATTYYGLGHGCAELNSFLPPENLAGKVLATFAAAIIFAVTDFQARREGAGKVQKFILVLTVAIDSFYVFVVLNNLVVITLNVLR